MTLQSNIRAWKAAGYQLKIIYLKLATAKIGLQRIAARVKQGGHSVEKEDVLRRFERSWSNFLTVYLPLADSWAIYDNSSDRPILLEQKA